MVFTRTSCIRMDADAKELDVVELLHTQDFDCSGFNGRCLECILAVRDLASSLCGRGSCWCEEHPDDWHVIFCQEASQVAKKGDNSRFHVFLLFMRAGLLKVLKLGGCERTGNKPRIYIESVGISERSQSQVTNCILTVDQRCRQEVCPSAPSEEIGFCRQLLL